MPKTWGSVQAATAQQPSHDCEALSQGRQTEGGEMMKSYEFQADMIFAQLVDGCVDLFHHLSTMDGDEVLEAVLEKWVDGKEDVAFSHHFTLSSVLGASIESHEHRQLGSVIEERGGGETAV